MKRKNPPPPPEGAGRTLALLAILELASFAWAIPSMGFYHDDWVLFETLSAKPGILDGIRALVASGLGARPLALALYSLAFALGGLSPAPYQALLSLLDWAGACLLFLFLRRLTGRRGFAAAAAALALLYPASAATHHWFSSLPQAAGLDLVLASLCLGTAWLESGRRAALAGAACLYSAGLLCYEAAALLPLMLAAGWAVREGPRSGLRALLPYAPILAAAFLWQKLGVPWFFAYQSPKTVALSAAAFARAYGSGLWCLTAGSWGLVKEGAGAMGVSPWLWAAAMLSAAAALGFPRNAKDGHPAPFSAWAAGLAALAGAYALYGLAGYEARAAGYFSRINQTGALGAALLLAAALELLPRRLSAPALALLAAPFAASNAAVASQWAASWKYQRDGLARISAQAKTLPQGSTLLVLWQQPAFPAADGFYIDEPWGFKAAVRLASRRPDLDALLQTPWMQSEGSGVVERLGGRETRRFRYGRLYHYDLASGRLMRLERP